LNALKNWIQRFYYNIKLVRFKLYLQWLTRKTRKLKNKREPQLMLKKQRMTPYCSHFKPPIIGLQKYETKSGRSMKLLSCKLGQLTLTIQHTAASNLPHMKGPIWVIVRFAVSCSLKTHWITIWKRTSITRSPNLHLLTQLHLHPPLLTNLNALPPQRDLTTWWSILSAATTEIGDLTERSPFLLRANESLQSATLSHKLLPTSHSKQLLRDHKPKDLQR